MYAIRSYYERAFPTATWPHETHERFAGELKGDIIQGRDRGPRPGVNVTDVFSRQNRIVVHNRVGITPVEIRFRITSYNVCYTKLLRVSLNLSYSAVL